MINEAVYTLYEGVGTVASIDMALKLGANHPMGPLELADFIGLDTCLAIMNVLHEGLADTKYRPCPLLVKYVEAGWLGRKTKRGFYDYRGEKPVPTRGSRTASARANTFAGARVRAPRLSRYSRRLACARRNRPRCCSYLLIGLLALPLPAAAAPWKLEPGDHRHGRRRLGRAATSRCASRSSTGQVDFDQAHPERPRPRSASPRGAATTGVAVVDQLRAQPRLPRRRRVSDDRLPSRQADADLEADRRRRTAGSRCAA